MLNLSRNLGLVTGASVMGAIFALGSAASDLAATPAESVAAGTRATFAAATVLVGISLALGWGRRTNATSGPAPAAERH